MPLTRTFVPATVQDSDNTCVVLICTHRLASGTLVRSYSKEDLSRTTSSMIGSTSLVDV